MVISYTRHRHHLSLGVLAILLLVSLSLTGCKMDANEEFIQGQWYDNNDHLSNIPAESREETFWSFDNKTFEVYGCCFVEMEYSGYYRVIKSDGDTLLLELYQLKGQSAGIVYSPSDTLELTIKIDRQADTIELGKSDPHIRVGGAP